MIDLENAQKEFLKYVSNFDNSEYKIDLKKHHSIRVMELSKEIADNIFEDKEKKELATLIGLLHDIARFEQYTRYKTFKDNESIDHGDYGVEILKKDNYIRNYIKTEKYDQIIFTAIKNHNKFEIEKGISNEELTYAKIVRDADKLDIFYEGVTMFWKNINESEKEILESETLSPDVKKSIYAGKQLKREKGKKYNKIDTMLSIIAFIYDINYEKSFKILQENDYINELIGQFNFKNQKTKEQIEEFRKIANKYIEEKINQ